MKKVKAEVAEVTETISEIPLNELDGSIVDIITVLKKTKTLYAVGSIKNTRLTPELNELLLFVGISAKQSGNRVLFAWTEAINSNEGWPDETS